MGKPKVKRTQGSATSSKRRKKGCLEVVVVKPSIPHHLFLTNIVPMIPRELFEKRVMKAVEQRNLQDLYTLVGRTAATVPSYLTQNASYAEAAGFTLLLPVLQRLGFHLSEKIFVAAVRQNGNVDILEWLQQHQCPLSEMTFSAATKHGNLNTLTWLQQHGCTWNDRTFSFAVQFGNTNTLMWLKEQGCPMTEFAFAFTDDVHILEWLKKNGCPWTDRTFAAAATVGYLDTLKWLKKNGCQWNALTFAFAAENGNLDNMQWLKDNNCPWDIRTVLATFQERHFDNLPWLETNGFLIPIDDDDDSIEGNHRFLVPIEHEEDVDDLEEEHGIGMLALYQIRQMDDEVR